MPNFVSFAASIAELAHGEQSRTQSINHSSSLFAATGTEACASELRFGIYLLLTQMIIIVCFILALQFFGEIILIHKLIHILLLLKKLTKRNFAIELN